MLSIYIDNFRQACAPESAALMSGLSVTVVMLARTLTLNDNTTCQLWEKQKNICTFLLSGY